MNRRSSFPTPRIHHVRWWGRQELRSPHQQTCSRRLDGFAQSRWQDAASSGSQAGHPKQKDASLVLRSQICRKEIVITTQTPGQSKSLSHLRSSIPYALKNASLLLRLQRQVARRQHAFKGHVGGLKGNSTRGGSKGVSALHSWQKRCKRCRLVR